MYFKLSTAVALGAIVSCSFGAAMPRADVLSVEERQLLGALGGGAAGGAAGGLAQQIEQKVQQKIQAAKAAKANALQGAAAAATPTLA
jgi:hypothetical protein